MALQRYRDDGLEMPHTWDFVINALEMDKVAKHKVDACVTSWERGRQR